MPAVNEIVDEISQQAERTVTSSTVGKAKSRKLIIRLENNPDDLPQNPIVEISTAVIVSTLLHVVVLVVLATWYLNKDKTRDDFVLNSAINESDQKEELDNPFSVKLDRVDKNTENIKPVKLKLLSNSSADSKSLPKTDLQKSLFGSISTGLGAGSKGASGITNLFGSGTEANSYIFIVDCSESMNYGRRFYLAIRELHKAVRRLKPNQKFFVFFYNDDYYTMNGFNRRSGGKMLKANKRNKKEAGKFINSRTAWGGTQPARSLEFALKMKPEVIYFLTDGEIPWNTNDVIRRYNKSKTVINTVALGFRGSEVLMRKIAKENRGNYRFIEDPSFAGSGN